MTAVSLSRTLSFATLIAFLSNANPALAAWNSASGIKDGPEAVVEGQNPWDGERLLVFGGTINFAGSVQLDGELWMQAMSGWPNPIVNIPGTFSMFSPSSQFRLVGGADLNIGSAAASSIEVSTVLMNGGSQLTIGDLTAHDNVEVLFAGTSLHVLNDYVQDGGGFVVRFDGAAFSVDGAFTMTGHGDWWVHSPNFSIGNPGASTVEAGNVSIIGGMPVTIGQLTAHDNVEVLFADTSLHVLGDYMQSNGDFVVRFDDAAFAVDGTFTKFGNGDWWVHTPNFNIGNPAGSTVEAGNVSIIGGMPVTIGQLTAHDNVEVLGTGTSLHVLSDYMQDGGALAIGFGSQIHVDGTFTKTGSGRFDMITPGTILSIGNPSESSLESGITRVLDGTQLTIGHVTTHGDTHILGIGSLLHVLEDYVQDGGDLSLAFQGSLDVDGIFTKTGTGRFDLTHTGSTLNIGNPGASSLEAGLMRISEGNQLTIGQVITHDNTEVHSAGTALHVLGDYQQDGGYLSLAFGGALDVDGTFTKTGTGRFELTHGGTTLTIGNPSASSLEAGSMRISEGNQFTIGQVITHDNTEVHGAGTAMHVLGDYQQDGGYLWLQFGGQLFVDGKLTKAGSGDFIVYEVSLIPGDAAASSVEADVVSLAFNSEVTIGSLTAHSNVQVDNGAKLHVLGDFTQDGGYFKLQHTSTAVDIDGSFTKTGVDPVEIYNLAFTAGNTDLNSASIAFGAQVTTANMTSHGTVVVDHTDTLLHVQGSYVQDGGNFRLSAGATMNIDGTFSYVAGNAFEVRNNSTLTTGNSMMAPSIANSVLVDTGGQASIGHLTAHGNVSVQSANSILRVRGDYLQDAGVFAIGDGGTLSVDGSFRYTVDGPMFVSFGNGLLTVGDTLSLEEGHFWNLAASGGKVRVGEGIVVPAAGTMRITDNGTLAGEGTVVGDVINSGGAVSPGSSSGRLDITGNYTQGSTAELLVEIGGSLSEVEYDQLFVSGSANLAGLLAVDLIDAGAGTFSPILGQTFDVLKAGGGITGTFGSVDLPELGGGLDWKVNYLANRVQLEVIQGAMLPGDYDFDGDVDGRDFLKWQRGESTNFLSAGDLTNWQANYGASLLAASRAVPEPANAMMCCAVLLHLMFAGRRLARQSTH